MSEKNGSGEPKPTIDQLRAEIKQTRAELGETVQALAAKADVKARAKEQVELTRLKVRAQAVEATERVRVAAVAAAGAVSGKVREATDQVREATDQAAVTADRAAASDLVTDVRERVRNSPVPLPLVFAGVAAIVGVILIVRGRQR